MLICNWLYSQECHLRQHIDNLASRLYIWSHWVYIQQVVLSFKFFIFNLFCSFLLLIKVLLTISKITALNYWKFLKTFQIEPLRISKRKQSDSWLLINNSYPTLNYILKHLFCWEFYRILFKSHQLTQMMLYSFRIFQHLPFPTTNVDN